MSVRDSGGWEGVYLVPLHLGELLLSHFQLYHEVIGGDTHFSSQSVNCVYHRIRQTHHSPVSTVAETATLPALSALVAVEVAAIIGVTAGRSVSASWSIIISDGQLATEI